MKTKLCTTAMVLLFTTQIIFAQHHLAQKIPDSTTLEIVGSLRIDSLKSIASPQKILTIDSSTGKLATIFADSFKQNLVSNQVSQIMNFVSGDTIHAGDCVTVGDGISGIALTSYNYHDPVVNVDGFEIVKNFWAAQTFTADTKTVAIKSVFIQMTYQQHMGSIDVSIRNVVNGIPVGSDINNQIAIVSGNLPPNSGFNDMRIVFNPPVPIIGGRSYAIVIRAHRGDSIVCHRHVTSYSDKTMSLSSDSGIIWAATFKSLLFKLFEVQTIAGQAYRTNPICSGRDCLGWDVVSSCYALNIDCFPFGECDLVQNTIGVAVTSANPGQMVTVQTSGINHAVSGFRSGSLLYVSLPRGTIGYDPGNWSKCVGLYTGSGMVIRISP